MEEDINIIVNKNKEKDKKKEWLPAQRGVESSGALLHFGFPT